MEEKKNLKALVTQKDGKMLAVASTEDEDRVGDKLKVTDWDLENFKKNPVIQAGHDYKPQFTIGVAENIHIDRKKKRLVFEPVFHTITQLAREIKEMYEQDFLRAFSVGYMPAKEEGGKNQLLEISAVAVPANPNALVVAKSLKNNKVEEIEAWIKDKCKEKEYGDSCKAEYVEKPYPNEHSCRLRDPKDFQPDSFRSTTRKHNGKEYRVIMGKLKGETTMTEQGYRYPKDIWTEAEARKHCEDHKGIRFEPAVKEEKQMYECECLNCGYKLKTDKHCRNVKCPKCGGEMRRIERPGPGKAIESKGVIPFKDTGKAPESEPWNAGEELKKATGNAKRLETMHAWVDKSDTEHFDPSERKWYKLPHHKGDGRQVAVWRGVAAAMAALFGARGGVKIPDSDRKGVYNHLAKHYKQWDKPVPEFREYNEDELKKLAEKGLIILEEDKKEKQETVVKEGRVLSSENRRIISETLEVLKEAERALKRLLTLSEPPQKENQKVKVDQVNVETIVRRALQKIARNSNFALSQIKKKNK